MADTEVAGWRESEIYEEHQIGERRRWKCRHCGKWDGVHGRIHSRETDESHDCPWKGRCGYEQFEPDNTDDPITHEQALDGINRIRNSIVGAQKINWSEHIYPLVSLLDRAGYEGLPYGEAQANIGIVLDRIDTAEKALDVALAAMSDLTRARNVRYPLQRHHREALDEAIDQARAALRRE